MFSKLVVFSGLLAVALCAVLEPVPIVSQVDDASPDGSFKWSFEAGDGTKQQQTGTVHQVGDVVAESVEGEVSYTDPEGHVHSLKYVADENGYHPQGEDLPVAPAVPAAIAKSLEYIAAHPQVEVKTV